MPDVCSIKTNQMSNPKIIGKLKNTDMKTNKIKLGTIIKLVISGLALLLAIPFCMGMYAGFKSHSGTTGAIYKSLEQHCNCNTIEIDYSAYGLQFSSEDGVTGQKASYILKDCPENLEAQTEAERLHTILLNNVDRYEQLDRVTFQIIANNTTYETTIKNGKL